MRGAVRIAAALWLALPAAAAAQGLATGAVTGRITDAASRPLLDVVVTIEREGTGRRIVLRTDRDGRYTAAFLDAGRYDAIFERLGYTPLRVQGIEVGPGERAQVSAALQPAGAAGAGAEVRQAGAALSIFGLAAPSHWVTGTGASALPLEGRGLSAIAALSSRFGPELGVDGLPGSLTVLIIDGLPTAQRPDRLSRYARNAAFPLTSFSATRTLPSATDAEWPGSAGGYVLGLSRAGGGVLNGEAGGDWTGDALAGGGAPSFNAIRAAGRIGGSIVRDTSAFAAGVEVLRARVPFAQPWTTDPATMAVIEAATAAGAPLPEAAPALSSLERLAAWGRFDLRLGDRHDLAVAANVSVLPEIDPLLASGGRLAGVGTAVDGREIFATARLVSRIGDATTNEIDAAVESSRLGWEPQAGASDPPPRATVLSADRSFGAADRLIGEQTLLGVFLRETIFFETGAHAVKLGLTADFPSYVIGGAPSERGAFVFDSPASIVSRRGVFERIEGVPASADIGFARFALFVHDAWSPTPALDLSAGMRIAMTRMPDTTNLDMDDELVRLLGVDNRSYTERFASFEPRVALRWRPNPEGDLLLHAYAQIDASPVDPGLVGEVFLDDGGRRAFRGVGELGTWPAVPDTFTAGSTGRRIVLLGPRFRGPESTRAGAGLAWQLGGGGALGVSFDVRRTEHLPRRRDVNQLPVEVAFDQHDRPIWGVLTKVGSVLAAAPGSNQNFAEFDRLWAIEATGSSRYGGVTVTVDRPLGDGIALFGSYSYSKTEDDWPAPEAADPAAQITPFPRGLAGVDWLDGRSDYDVPHRLTAGAELRAPGRFGPRFAALYRFHSGFPFTPGFRDGVDANGDGSALNDPAFIDTGLPGMDDAIAAWPCLNESAGAFVDRNACRGPDVHALDARMIIDIAGTGRYRAELVLDALNLIASDYGLVDDALLLVDPDAPLGADAFSVSVPLTVNPEFGTLRTRYAAERLFRIGLRLRY